MRSLPAPSSEPGGTAGGAGTSSLSLDRASAGSAGGDSPGDGSGVGICDCSLRASGPGAAVSGRGGQCAVLRQMLRCLRWTIDSPVAGARDAPTCSTTHLPNELRSQPAGGGRGGALRTERPCVKRVCRPSIVSIVNKCNLNNLICQCCRMGAEYARGAGDAGHLQAADGPVHPPPGSNITAGARLDEGRAGSRCL